MPQQRQLSERAATWILRILVGGFIALGVAMVTFMLGAWYQGRTAKIANLALRAVVTEIYQPDPHETQWYVAKLRPANSIVLEHEMLGVVQVGDSISKQKGQDFYTVWQKSSGKTTRFHIIQP